MECFEARNQLNDWIDGSMSSKTHQDFESHLETCRNCGNQNLHIRALIETLQKQPRAQMPPELRAGPLAFRVPVASRLKNFKLFWKELPAPTRLLTEGVLIAGVVILGVQLGPQVRMLYEKSVDERLEKMIRAEDYETADVPLARGKADADPNAVSEEHETFQDDAEVGSTHEEMHVGKGEIWRFNVKTDSPSLVRAKIMKSFAEIGIPSTTAGFSGVEAPGGIQFDILVPTSSVQSIKSNLEKVAAQQSDPSANFNDAFTWYKNRSKKPIPNGTTRVVIWLSQI